MPTKGEILRYSALVTVSGQGDARVAITTDSKALVLVHRDVHRSLVFKCPSGCEDVLTINLDSRAGVAWRMRITQGGVTLMPSIWRTEGCRAHFVLWNSTVWWCRFEDEDPWPNDMEEELREEWKRIRAQLRRPKRRR